MRKSLLFVDDDPFILDALRRQLRRYRKEWDVEFAPGGAAALELMERQSFDIVISDMRMPEMDGAELLAEVLRRHPRTVRIVLSGQSERELRFETLAPAHQYLSKPCDLDALKDVIEYASRLRDYLPNEELCSVVSSVATLPALPESISKLSAESVEDELSSDFVGDVVCNDPCLSAEVLQLANSPFFGVSGSATHPREAVAALGVGLVAQLIERSVQVDAGPAWPDGFSIERLAEHSRHIAGAARSWIVERGGDEITADAAWTAGLLHDIGRVVLSISLPELYRCIINRAQESDCSLLEAERDELGTTHAEVGGYLLRLWRLPESIVDAVTYLHDSEAIAGDASVLSALRAGVAAESS
jgi:HD-like signal output (HDOD) protein